MKKIPISFNDEDQKFHCKASMRNVIHNLNLKRKTMTEYKQMRKKEVIRSLSGFLSNFDVLRHKVVEIQLENNFLKRKLQLLKEQLDFYKGNFRPLKKPRRKTQ